MDKITGTGGLVPTVNAAKTTFPAPNIDAIIKSTGSAKISIATVQTFTSKLKMKFQYPNNDAIIKSVGDSRKSIGTVKTFISKMKLKMPGIDLSDFKSDLSQAVSDAKRARREINNALKGVKSGGGGDLGAIVRISPDGSTVDNPWVTLPEPNPAGSQGIVYGLHVDTTGAFNGDLIALTHLGNVWRISSSGSHSHCPLAMLGRRLDGVTTVPNNSIYGPWAGKILVGAPFDTGFTPPAEQSGIYAISGNGNIRFFSTSQLHISERISEGCNISVIPDNENFFALQYSAPPTLPERTVVWAAKPSDFTNITGDILLQIAFPSVNLGPSFGSRHSSGLWSIRWDDARQDFQSTLLSTTYNPPIDWGAVRDYVHHWTGMTFAPAYITGLA